MRLSKTYLVPLFFVLAAPQIANAREAVFFELKDTELQTAEKRELLFERMTKAAHDNCKTSSVFATKESVEDCAVDLRSQWLEEIGSDELKLLAEVQISTPYRYASL